MKRILQSLRAIMKRNKQVRAPRFPIRLTLELTNACNLRCSFCYQSNPAFASQRGFMDFALFNEAVHEFAALQKKARTTGSVSLYTTGESLLHPQWDRMLTTCSQLHLYTVLSSNGQLLNEKNCQAMIDGKLQCLRLSIEGYTKDMYEAKRIRGNFELLRHNLTEMKNLFSKHPRKRPLVQARAVLLPEEHTMEYYQRFFECWSPFVDQIDFNSVETQQGQMVTSETKNNLTNKKNPCPFAFDGLTINWDGSAGFCCTDYEHVIKIGKFPEQSLQQIWEGKPLAGIRKRFLSGAYNEIPVICRTCEKAFLIREDRCRNASFRTDQSFTGQAHHYPWLYATNT